MGVGASAATVPLKKLPEEVVCMLCVSSGGGENSYQKRNIETVAAARLSPHLRSLSPGGPTAPPPPAPGLCPTRRGLSSRSDVRSRRGRSVVHV